MMREENDFVKVEKQVRAGIHSIGVVKKLPPLGAVSVGNKYKNDFYMKKEACSLLAQTEVVAQEVMRILCPGQPKTRLVGKTGVLSKAVEGFISFHDLGMKNVQEKVLNHEYTGFGRTLVAALLVNEVDLKNDNIGVDAKGQVVKIDGGLCFSDSVTEATQVAGQITALDLRNLPSIKNYTPYNWLDRVVYYHDSAGSVKRGSVLCDVRIQDDPVFKKEIYQGILCGLLLVGVQKITTLWIKEVDWQKEVFRVLEKRKFYLQKSAFQNGYFVEYLLSKEAEVDAIAHISYLKDFTIKGKEKLMGVEEVQQYGAAFEALLKRAKESDVHRMQKYQNILKDSLGLVFEEKQSREGFQKTIAVFDKMALKDKYKVLNALVVYGYQNGFIEECQKLVSDLLNHEPSIILDVKNASTAYALLDIIEKNILERVRLIKGCAQALTSPIDRSGLVVQDPLIVAVYRNNMEGVQACLKLGWDVNIRDMENKTPIIYAAERHELEMMDFLIAAGADLELQDEDGNRPLDVIGLSDPEQRAFLMGKGTACRPQWLQGEGVVPELLRLAQTRTLARVEPDVVKPAVQFSHHSTAEKVDAEDRPYKKHKPGDLL